MKDILFFGAIFAALYLFANAKQLIPVESRPPMPSTPCPQGGTWMWNTSPMSESFNSWICVGSNLRLPITQHADGHYYDANGVLIS